MLRKPYEPLGPAVQPTDNGFKADGIAATEFNGITATA